MDNSSFRFLVIVVVVVIVVVILLLRALYTNVLFAPSRRYDWTPSESYDTVTINGAHGWWFNHFPDRKTVLFCHGSGGNLSHREYIIAMCRLLKLNLLLFDYRGYGENGSIATPDTIMEDGLAMYDYLVQYVPECQIIVWGESLGGSVAARIALDRPNCRALVLMGTFSSLDDIIFDGRYGTPFQVLRVALQWTSNMLPTKELMPKITVPVIVVHSENDDLIPIDGARRLYDRVSHDRKLFVTITGGHTTPKITPEQLRQIVTFCDIDGRSCPEACEATLTAICRVRRRLGYDNE